MAKGTAGAGFVTSAVRKFQMLRVAAVCDRTNSKTGQGRGGSGVSFFKRDYGEDELNDSHPVATVTGWPTRPGHTPR